MLHEDLKRFFSAFPKDAHPMGVCSAVISALSTFYPEDLDPLDAKQVAVSIRRLIAKFPTIAAYANKHSIGHPFMYPDNKLGYVENFLRMMFGTPCEEFVVDPVVARAIDVLLILHADHEQNCSTSTVRLAGSSHANLFASMSAGIAALWGPRHGGANQEVIEMLEAIAEEGLTAQPVRGPREVEGRHLAADGLRPPRVPQLRSARERDQEGRERRAREAGRQLEAARDRDGPRAASRSRTTTSSSAASTRTSTSTRA